jgi:hypothetical protein
MAFEGTEATAHVRDIVGAEGKGGWFSTEAPVHCYKNLWRSGEESAYNVIIYEANQRRPSCNGFYQWAPGRSPEDHLKLEDERRTFSHQRGLAWLAFAGGLFGALIGASVGYFFKKP